MNAIVYTSKTGHTKAYAELLSAKTGLSAYQLKDVGSAVARGSDVIYLGWVSAGKVNGFAKARKLFNVRAVCAVGMDPSGGQHDDIVKANNTGDVPVFVLHGGLETDKLRGLTGVVMRMMSKGVAGKLEAKTDRTPAEDDMLELMKHGGSRVTPERLAPVLEWYGKNA